MLERCALSVHLIGETFGAMPDGPSQKSVAMFQNELAVAACRSRPLRRLIWLPEGTKSSHEAQQKLIESFLSDSEYQFGADLITSDFEAFKSSVHVTLKILEEPQQQRQMETEDGDHQVYIICDKRDLKATIPLRKFLNAQKTQG
jgi:hypothetical protein